MDIEKAISFMTAHLQSHSIKTCAKHLREALEAGGAVIKQPPGSAKDYGPILEHLGMKPIPLLHYVPRRGDIVVIQPPAEADPDGHVAMFDGTSWLSDFRQRDIWAGPVFRQAKPSMSIYRQ